MLWSAPSNGAAPADTLGLRSVVAQHPRAAQEMRLLLLDNATLERDLAHSQAALRASQDSSRIREEFLQREADWWRERAPRWYEQPGFVAGVTAVLVAVVVAGSMHIVTD